MKKTLIIIGAFIVLVIVAVGQYAAPQLAALRSTGSDSEIGTSGVEECRCECQDDCYGRGNSGSCSCSWGECSASCGTAGKINIARQ
jgi:hypothetical protein